jgi:hypothetical protein
MNIMKSIPVLMMLVAGLLLTACSQQPAKPGADSAEKIVEQRAKQRWELLIARDYLSAYTYLTPGYRMTTPADVYSVDLRTSPVKWESAEFDAVSCSMAEKCQADFIVVSKVMGMLQGVDVAEVKSKVTEDWLFLDGEWYYSPQP